MTTRPITLEIHDSHLYPGALGTAVDAIPAGGCADPRRCIVLFADGTAVQGSIRQIGAADFALDVPAYTTARGTRIAAKAWLMTITASAEGRASVRARKRL